MNPFHLLRRFFVYIGRLFLHRILNLQDVLLAREILEVSKTLPITELGSADGYLSKLDKVESLYHRLEDIVEIYYSLVFWLNESFGLKGKSFALVDDVMRYNQIFLLHSLSALCHCLEVHPLIKEEGGLFVRFDHLQQQICQTFSQLEIHDFV